MKKDKNNRSQTPSYQSAESTLQEHKKKIGEVVYVSISARTTFEFPAHLSQEEREVRIANYMKRRKPMIQLYERSGQLFLDELLQPTDNLSFLPKPPLTVMSSAIQYTIETQSSSNFGIV